MTRDYTRRSFLAATSGAGALAFGIGTGGAQQGPTFTLTMTPNGWVGQSPSSIQGQNSPTLDVESGQTVTVKWTNQTEVLHNFAVTKGYPGGRALFRSDYVAPGGSQTVTFDAEQGLAAYYSETDLDAKGNIVVDGQRAAATTATPVERNLTENPASVPYETYRFTGGTSGWHGLAPKAISGTTNPTIQLVPGKMYQIIWMNADGAMHNWQVENAEGQILVRSDTLQQAGSYQTVKFTAREEMTEYFCQYHPLRMRGEIEIVSEQQAAQQQTTTAGGNESQFQHHTVSRDISGNATQGTTAGTQTTMGNQTTAAGGETTMGNQTTLGNQTTAAGTQTTVGNETTAAGGGTTMGNQTAGVGNQTTAMGNETTAMGNQTTAGNASNASANAAGSAEQSVRAPGFGALTALGGIGGVMSYLLSRGDEEE